MTLRTCVPVALGSIPIVACRAQAGIIADPPACGDGSLDPGEECDPPVSTCAAPCRADCTCDVPLEVGAGLAITSARGPIPYQFDLLRTAFDNAWVGN